MASRGSDIASRKRAALLRAALVVKDDAIVPLAIPALVSVPAGFLLAWLGTMIGAGRVASTGMPYDEFERRAFAPDETAEPGGRFTRRPEPERAGVA